VTWKENCSKEKKISYETWRSSDLGSFSALSCGFRNWLLLLRAPPRVLTRNNERKVSPFYSRIPS
jgi:hypothetical protein